MPPPLVKQLGTHSLAWLPVLFWMGLIFYGSSDALSTQNTSRIIGPFLQWLIPDITDAAIAGVQVVVRKGGHLAEYGVLALLLWHGLRRSRGPVRGPWLRWQAWTAWAVASLYAVTDEWHQSWVASRQGSAGDVLIDSCGAALALWAVSWLGRRWGWWSER